MKKILLIIDPQYDFIEGGKLAVNGAEEKMSNLATFIAEHGTDYDSVIITADFHPYNHCSFKINGGEWPVHCIQHSEGAAIFEPILQSAYGIFMPNDVHILTKGEDPNKEEYSIVENSVNGNKLLNFISSQVIEQVDVCGLCGDFCVGQTITDLCKHKMGKKIRVLTPFIQSIDDGSVLAKIIKDNELKEITNE